VDWLTEVCEELHYVTETLFLTVNYLDRFLSRKNVPKKRLQLVGLACLFVASKYEEISPCTVHELSKYSNNSCSPEDILAMEWCVLNALVI
jgi:cyclin-A